MRVSTDGPLADFGPAAQLGREAEQLEVLTPE